MDTRQLIDFLTLTTHDIDNWFKLIPFTKHDEIGQEIKPFGLYDKAWEILPAGRIDVSNDKQQGAMLTLTGGDLQKWRELGIGSQGIVTHAVSAGKVTRLDFAIDQTGDIKQGARLKKAFQGHVNRGEYKGIKPDTDIASKGDGYTQYFGSKNSLNRVRVYDKAAQQKLLHIAWLRVELQTRGKQADTLAQDMARTNFADAGKAKLKKLLDFPRLKWWGKMMQHDPVELTEIPRSEPKFWAWLDAQVKPAMEKKMWDYDDNVRLIKWLSERLTDAHRIQYTKRKR